MKTTIVVEDGGVATLPFGSEAAAAVQSDPRASQSAPLDAGAAPTGGVGQPGSEALSNGRSDGGMPPSWLVEAIAQAGGMTAPSSSEDIEPTGLDAGAAPT
jgi:hypothetical protein